MSQLSGPQGLPSVTLEQTPRSQAGVQRMEQAAMSRALTSVKWAWVGLLAWPLRSCVASGDDGMSLSFSCHVCSAVARTVVAEAE